jgi:hypothetical protein
MSTASVEAEVGVTSAGTATYCLKRLLKLSTVRLRFGYGGNRLVITLNLDLNDEGARYDSGFDDSGPFADTPPPGGVALDSALGAFGPAAIDDLIPRLRVLAAALDQAHAAGFVHGRLHPSKVIVTDEGTYVMGRRVPASATLTREADQYALATIAYEWMFGRPIASAGDRPVDVRSIPGVDRAALTRAFTRARAPEPSRRFGSCSDFVDAIAGSVIPSLPLMADDDDADPIGPFIPEEPAPAVPIAAPTPVPDLSFTAEESNVTAAEPDLDGTDYREPGAGPPSLEERASARSRRSGLSAAEAESREPEVAVAVPAWQSSADETRKQSGERFSGFALILAAIVGMVAGFAAGYMAKPRALQTAPEEMATGSEAPLTEPQGAQGARGAQGAQGAQGAPPEPEAPRALSAPSAPARIGRLLVRSTPSGASVEVDGVARGVTPLALRDLDLGAREITVTRRGYVPEVRRMVLTKARPSRSVEVRLSTAAAAAPPRPSTPASRGQPAVSTGALAVESRPVGARVTVNGKPSGNTPLTITDLPPGEYRVTISLPGYRNVATTVRVVAGERARAAARLTEQEQE